MKKPLAQIKEQAAFHIPRKETHRNDSSPLPVRRFAGTDNPRHLRVLSRLLVVPLMLREHLDAVAGASNGPALVADLRGKGLELPCSRVNAIDRDGRTCKPGLYLLTAADRALIHAARLEGLDCGERA
jgi:hypothetical protein